MRRAVAVEERLAVVRHVGDRPAPGVAGRARLDLGPLTRPVGQARRHARGVAHAEAAVVHRAQALDEQAHRGRVAAGQAALLPVLGPRDVRRPRSVARLARHVDLGPRRLVGVGRQVVVAPEIGRVAVGAHVVPVLVRARPVERIVVRDLLLRVEVEPALAALRPWAASPRRWPGTAGARPETRRGTAAADGSRTCT